MSSLWNAHSCAYAFPQHTQAMVTKNSRFNFSAGTSRASLSQCHWCPAYIVFKGLPFIVALKKSLIRPSEGRKKDLLVKILSKDVCMVPFQSSSWTTQQKGIAPKTKLISKEQPGLSSIFLNKPLIIDLHWLKTSLLSFSMESEFHSKQLQRLRPLNSTVKNEWVNRHDAFPKPHLRPKWPLRWETLPLRLSGKAENTTGQCCPAPLPYLVLTSTSVKSAHILAGQVPHSAVQMAV